MIIPLLKPNGKLNEPQRREVNSVFAGSNNLYTLYKTLQYALHSVYIYYTVTMMIAQLQHYTRPYWWLLESANRPARLC